MCRSILNFGLVTDRPLRLYSRFKTLLQRLELLRSEEDPSRPVSMAPSPLVQTASALDLLDNGSKWPNVPANVYLHLPAAAR